MRGARDKPIADSIDEHLESCIVVSGEMHARGLLGLLRSRGHIDFTIHPNYEIPHDFTAEELERYKWVQNPANNVVQQSRYTEKMVNPKTDILSFVEEVTNLVNNSS